MGNSVDLYASNHDSLDRTKSADDDSTWVIRGRRYDAPPLLWIACFKKEDINLESEIDEDDGRSFDDANFFTPHEIRNFESVKPR